MNINLHMHAWLFIRTCAHMQHSYLYLLVCLFVCLPLRKVKERDFFLSIPKRKKRNKLGQKTPQEMRLTKKGTKKRKEESIVWSLFLQHNFVLKLLSPIRVYYWNICASFGLSSSKLPWKKVIDREAWDTKNTDRKKYWNIINFRWTKWAFLIV